MPHTEKPPAFATLTAKDNVGSGKNDTNHNSEIDQSSQAEIERSPAVAAAIDRDRKRLLGIKRASLWSLANMAGARIDEVMQSLENADDEEMIACGRLFIENARGFAKLLANFRDAREANQ